MGSIGSKKKIGSFPCDGGAQNESCCAERNLNEARTLRCPQRLHESRCQRDHHNLRETADQRCEKQEHKVWRHCALNTRYAELERRGNGSEAQQRKELREADQGPRSSCDEQDRGSGN